MENNFALCNIKESPSEWKIVEICTFDADMHGYYTLGATKGYQEWDTMLINKSTPLEYDGEGFLVRQPQKNVWWKIIY